MCMFFTLLTITIYHKKVQAVNIKLTDLDKNSYSIFIVVLTLEVDKTKSTSSSKV